MENLNSGCADDNNGGLDLKWPTIKSESIRPTTIPAVPTTSKSQHEAKKAYKNEYGYSISEVYDSHSQRNDPSPSTSTTVPDTQLLYHSLSNPLFKSNSLNIEPHGDVHKVSSPFKSSWIFSPSQNRLVEKRGSPKASSKLGSSSNFSSILSDNVTLSRPNKLNNASFGALDNSSYFSSIPSFDKLELFDDVVPGFLSTSTTAQPLAQKSFFGYNIKEVTSNGKTRGTVQVFGDDGVEKSVRYDELTKPSNVTKFLPTSTSTMKTPVVTTKKQSATTLKSATSTKRVPTSTTAIPAASSAKAESTTAGPRHIIIEDVQPFTQEFVHDQPIASEFATPEFILYDFLGQLQSFPHIPTENFDENRQTTYDELVSQNTFVYKKK